MEGKSLTAEDLKRIFANPFYCIVVDERMCAPHEPIVTEDEWIKSASNLIKEIGAEEFLKNLLENLRGNWV